MEHSIYNAPKSQLVQQNESAHPQFYVVSAIKFTVLFAATVGIYSIYWFYRNWKSQKLYNNLTIWPVPRSIFNIFFVKSLFGRIDDVVQEKNAGFNWNPDFLAFCYIIATIVSQVADRLSTNRPDMAFAQLLSVAMFPIMGFTLFRAQRAINFSQDDPRGESNNAFTLANIAWIIAGLILWGFVVLGVLLIIRQ